MWRTCWCRWDTAGWTGKPCWQPGLLEALQSALMVSPAEPQLCEPCSWGLVLHGSVLAAVPCSRARRPPELHADRWPFLAAVPQEHQRYHEVLVAEENKRKALLDIVYALEVGAQAAAWTQHWAAWRSGSACNSTDTTQGSLADAALCCLAWLASACRSVDTAPNSLWSLEKAVVATPLPARCCAALRRTTSGSWRRL